MHTNRRMIARYLNAAQSVMAVAVLNYQPGGEIFNWAAYVGVGVPADVAAHGDKLLAEQAATFFPSLPVELYRD